MMSPSVPRGMSLPLCTETVIARVGLHRRSERHLAKLDVVLALTADRVTAAIPQQPDAMLQCSIFRPWEPTRSDEAVCTIILKSMPLGASEFDVYPGSLG